MAGSGDKTVVAATEQTPYNQISEPSVSISFNPTFRGHLKAGRATMLRRGKENKYDKYVMTVLENCHSNVNFDHAKALAATVECVDGGRTVKAVWPERV